MQVNTISPTFKGSYNEIVVPKKITSNIKLAADKIRPLLQDDARSLHKKDNLTLEIFTDSMRIIHKKIDTHKKTSLLQDTVTIRTSKVFNAKNIDDKSLFSWYQKTINALFFTK